MLKAILESLDDLEEDLRAHYAEKTGADGKTIFVLQIDGFNSHPDVTALKGAHDRQKDANRTLRAENETLKARVEDLPEDFDGDAYEELKRLAEGKGPADPAELERTIADRVQKATQKAEKRATDAEAARDQAKERLREKERNEVLASALADAGVTDPVYLKAARAMLRDQLTVEEDEDTGEISVLALDAELNIKIPAAEHIKTWAQSDEGKSFVGERGNAGGGADGSGKGNKDSGPNPWKRETLNLTAQARIMREDPARAERLMKAAGKA